MALVKTPQALTQKGKTIMKRDSTTAARPDDDVAPVSPVSISDRDERAEEAAEKRTYGTSSSRKVLSILGYFDRRRPIATIDELANAIGVPKSTAYRYVSLLREMGFVMENGRGGYHLSPSVINMSAAARAAISYGEVARPFMEQLSDDSGETVLLVQRVGDNAVCVARAESTQPIRLSYDVGASFALHRGGAPGKLLLAYLEPRERDTYLARALPEERTAPPRAAFERELEQIRASGFALALNEIILDVCGMAVPIYETDSVVAALCVAGPSYRLNGATRLGIEALLRESAQCISAALSPAAPVVRFS